MSDHGDHAALSWLCTRLPELQAAADRDGWRHRLDTTVAAVRNGTPATLACRRLGLKFDAVQRQGTDTHSPEPGPATIADLGLDRVSQNGDYTCPRGICDRSGQPNRHGHEPVCIDGTPMLPPGA